jgi:hypothetical protein
MDGTLTKRIWTRSPRKENNNINSYVTAMKPNILSARKIFFAVAVFMLFQVFSAEIANGQTPPPPPPPPNGGPNNGHGLGGNQGPVGAPVGSGMEILLILGILYAGRSSFTNQKDSTGENDATLTH